MERLVTKPTGWLGVSGAVGPMLNPQRPQNRECSGKRFAQRGHGKEFGDSPALTSTNERFPQRPQNFTPSAKRELQFEHATIPGITLE